MQETGHIFSIGKHIQELCAGVNVQHNKDAVGFPRDWKRWVNAMFFVFFLCLRFESCFQTPTISHLYLWQKHPPHRHPSESKTCKPLHLTVTQVKQTFPLDSQLLLCSKQAFWLSGMSSSSWMALFFTSGVINVKYDSTSERRNCLKYWSIYETHLYFTRKKERDSKMMALKPCHSVFYYTNLAWTLQVCAKPDYLA